MRNVHFIKETYFNFKSKVLSGIKLLSQTWGQKSAQKKALIIWTPTWQLCKLCADEDHVVWCKAPEPLSGRCSESGQTVFANFRLQLWIKSQCSVFMRLFLEGLNELNGLLLHRLLKIQNTFLFWFLNMAEMSPEKASVRSFLLDLRSHIQSSRVAYWFIQLLSLHCGIGCQ